MPKKTRKPEKPLSRERVEAYEPEAVPYEVPDPGAHGLTLRVLPSGAKSWAFRYSLGGRVSRVSLGLWPSVTLDQARARAATLHGRVWNHEDPAAVLKKQKASALTITKLWDRFEAEHVATLRPSTQKGYKHYGKRYIIPEHGRLLVQEVGLGQVVTFRVEGAGTYFADGILNHNAKVILP